VAKESPTIHSDCNTAAAVTTRIDQLPLLGAVLRQRIDEGTNFPGQMMTTRIDTFIANSAGR
jgi:hypothetical protein